MPPLKPQPAGFRLATLADLPAVWVMMDDYKDQYVDDFETLELAWVLALIQNGQLWVIVEKTDYPVGALWWTNYFRGLHITLHGLLRPRYTKIILKSNIIPGLLDTLFQQLDIIKIKALAMQPQCSAIKLLKRFGFKQVGLLTKETLYRGRATDVLLFERTR